MTTTLYLIRHGKTQWNLEERMQGSLNSPLTDEGIAQASKLHKSLATHDFDLHITSCSERAQETAQLVFPEADLVLSDAFMEINMGSWEGKRFREIDANNPEQWYNFFKAPLDFIPDTGESFADVFTRVSSELNALLKENKGKKIAIISHRITIKVMLEYLLQGSMEHLGSAEDILPNSVSIIKIEGNKPRLVLRSDISHYDI